MAKRINLDIKDVYTVYVATNSCTETAKIFNVNHKVILRILHNNNMWDKAQENIFNNERELAIKVSKKYIEYESLEYAGSEYGLNVGPSKKLLEKHGLLDKSIEKIFNKSIGNKKRCNKCREYKDRYDFYPNTHTKDGLSSICNKCYATRINKTLEQYNLSIEDVEHIYYELESIDKVSKNIGVSKHLLEVGLTINGNLANIRNRIKNKDKKCSACKIIKPISNFSKSNGGFSAVCKACANQRSKIYKRNNPGVIIEWRKNNREHINAYQRKRRRTEKYKKYKREYDKNRKKDDIQYRLSCYIRSRFGKIIKNKQKTGSAVRNLGCSTEELKIYLEMFFYPNPKTGEMMTWENHSHNGWHIDHIIPLSSFDLTDKEQFLKACHYTNLQPLWSEENYKKYNKILDINYV